MTRISCISDLHGSYPQLPGGDLLIIAGDLTSNDSPAAWTDFFAWLGKQKYTKKICIAGNHDNWLKDKAPSKEGMWADLNCEYLCDSGCEFEGLKIWGSPHTLWFEGINPHCMAFTGNEEYLAEKFSLIPDDTDILITHMPLFGILDYTKRCVHVGSKKLLGAIDAIKPRVHIFGHIHEEGGSRLYYGGHTMCINASHMNAEYGPVNHPISFEL